MNPPAKLFHQKILVYYIFMRKSHKTTAQIIIIMNKCKQQTKGKINRKRGGERVENIKSVAESKKKFFYL